MNNDTYQRIYTKDEYLDELRRYLRKLPPDDFDSAMDYFIEYFEEAGPENEAQAIHDLGTPKEAASEILQNLLHDDRAHKDDTARTVKIAAIAMLLSPLGWLGALLLILFAIVAVSMIFAIVAAAVACEGALLYASCSVIFQGFTTLPESLSGACVLLGCGVFGFGIGLAVLSAGIALCRVIARGFVALVQHLTRQRRA